MIPVFFSYSHKDENFKNELETHLEILRKQNLINDWNDRMIAPGSNWEEDINLNLAKAKIILLLISSDFLASDYCYDTETIFAIEQHEKNLAKVLPIILRPCLWSISSFKHLQALPIDGKAITEFDNTDAAWLQVTEGIHNLVKQIKDEEKEKNKNPLVDLIAPKEVPVEVIKEVKKVRVQKMETPIEIVTSRSEIKRFLNKYNDWYFSPLRITKWGGKQQGFEELSKLSSKQIAEELNSMKSEGLIKSTTSKKGNPIYKMK